MKHFKIDGKKVVIPTEANELTFEQYRKVLDAKDNFTLLEILTGVPKKAWRNCKDIDGFNEVVYSIRKLFDLPEERSKHLHLKGKAYWIPDDFDVGDCTLGQYEDVKPELMKLFKEKDGEIQQPTEKDIVGIAPLLVATYIQGLEDEYDYKKARKLIPEIEKVSAWEVLTLANFFLLSAWSYYLGIPKTQLISLQLKKKEKQGFLGYLKNLVFSPHSTP